jgi:hypothetical protein
MISWCEYIWENRLETKLAACNCWNTGHCLWAGDAIGHCLRAGDAIRYDVSTVLPWPWPDNRISSSCKHVLEDQHMFASRRSEVGENARRKVQIPVQFARPGVPIWLRVSGYQPTRLTCIFDSGIQKWWKRCRKFMTSRRTSIPSLVQVRLMPSPGAVSCKILRSDFQL